MVTTILLARHGETDWNREHRVQGHTDRPLNDAGRAQALALARALADEPLDAVYASDLSRASETARAVAEPRRLPVRTLRELRERDFGTWEGLTDEEILLRFPHARRGHWGDGETNEAMAGRVVAALRRIAERHPGARVLVVSHGGPLRAVLRHCSAAEDGPIENCHVARLEIEGGDLRWLD
ncbi:MAG: histidine phosphatase family protein [Actinobacteria bacterium]|nr:histidine phosphatase family protein [Actinomycetota bacterium]